MRSEEQWNEVGKCPDCNSPILKMGDETKFTGPAECGCWLPVEGEMMDEKKYAIYKIFAQWNQNGLDHINSTGFSRMYKENPGIKGARQDAMNWWEEYISKPHGFKVTKGPSLIDIGHELIKLECIFYEWETWCIGWFNHLTYNIHLNDDELRISFGSFVDRKLPLQRNSDLAKEYRIPGMKTYCLMGADDTWRWTEPCRCEHCVKQEVVRIGH